MKIISNCPLCEEHSLHVIEHDKIALMQCLYCGYATSDKFIGDRETNPEYKKLTKEMQTWSTAHDGKIWIPGIITLPEGMIYPIETESELKWGYAKMVDIPEEEQKNYPNPEGGFYEQQYDVKNAIIYDVFYECLAELNKRAKEKRISKLDLPKLKKVISDAEKVQS